MKLPVIVVFNKCDIVNVDKMQSWMKDSDNIIVLNI